MPVIRLDSEISATVSEIIYNINTQRTLEKLQLTMRLILLLIFLFFLTSSILYAQSEPDQYLKVTYFQFQDNGIVFVNQLLDELKNSQMSRVENGEIEAWRFYEVLFSSNATHRYNFVVVEIADELNDLQTDLTFEENSLSGLAINSLLFSSKIHSEIWGARGKVYSDQRPAPSLYKNVNFMAVQSDRIDDYHTLEIDIAGPAQQYMTEIGLMDGWNFHRLIFPTGSAVKYNYTTSDFYSSLDQIENGINANIMSEVHPELNMSEFEDYADTIRERVWSDLWKLVESTD